MTNSTSIRVATSPKTKPRSHSNWLFSCVDVLLGSCLLSLMWAFICLFEGVPERARRVHQLRGLSRESLAPHKRHIQTKTEKGTQRRRGFHFLCSLSNTINNATSVGWYGGTILIQWTNCSTAWQPSIEKELEAVAREGLPTVDGTPPPVTPPDASTDIAAPPGEGEGEEKAPPYDPETQKLVDGFFLITFFSALLLSFFD